MPRIKSVLVTSDAGRIPMSPFRLPRTEFEIDCDADNALERVSGLFHNKWQADVHALRWIFPDDLLLPVDDKSAVLVLHVDQPGAIAHNGVCGGAAHLGNGGHLASDPILRAAIHPTELEAWSRPQWLDQTSEWVRSVLGRERIDQIAQMRVCINGAVLRIRTEKGEYFSKTLPHSFAHEIKLIELLDREMPGACPKLAEADPVSRTHVTGSINGVPLYRVDEPGRWATAMRQFAELQVQSISCLDQIRATGLPGQSFTDFRNGIGNLVSEIVSLQMNSANRLTQEELERVPSLIRKAIEGADVLGRCQIPETLVHGDLNESNIFLTAEDKITLIDWTFSRTGHPFFALGFSLFAAADQPQHRLHRYWRELRDAYLVPWLPFSRASDLEAGMEAASRLFWLDTAQVICRLVQQVRGEFPGTVDHLPLVLRRALSSFGLAG